MAVSIRETLSGIGNRVSSEESRNLGRTERWASVLGGAALAAIALGRRSKGTLGLAALGAPLIWRGATGHCPVYERMGVDRNPAHLNTAETAAFGTDERPVSTTDRQPIVQDF